MTVEFKILSSLVQQVREDLARPHVYAAERVGFIHCRVAGSKSGLIVLAEHYHPIADEDYLDDATVGAMMGPDAIRKALQFAYQNKVAMFHVHMHGHRGHPWFSSTDLRENAKFVPDFWNVRPEFPHGALVLSRDSLAGLCWMPTQRKPVKVSKFTIVGAPVRFVKP
jgi:hypothetical protein